MANIDFSLFKTFSLLERFKAQFRAEVFNMTNTPQFYGPNTTFGISTFGQITAQRISPGCFSWVYDLIYKSGCVRLPTPDLVNFS